jgi:hypothetical protein
VITAASVDIFSGSRVPATPHWDRKWAAVVSFSSVLVILAGVITIGLTFSPEASHSLEASAGSHKRDAPSEQPAKALSGCTLVPMKLSKVVHQLDGTTIYEFTGDGTWSDEYVPPAGFDPVTATDAQLTASGFPPRPPGDDAAALAAWRTAVGHELRAVVSDPVMAIGTGCVNPGGPEVSAASPSAHG